ncbi:MAG: AraC family transcriptional regulator [Balneolaceae bacterium]
MDDNSIYFRLPKTSRKGFILEFQKLPHMYDRLHYHPEMQLIYILEGAGDLFAGDSFVSYGPGSLFLFGPNQSHVFKSDPAYFSNDDLECRTISVFFHDKSLGDGFFDLEETMGIQSLIERSGRGIQFKQSVSEQMGSRIFGLIDLKGFERFMEILDILHLLSETDQYKYLATMNSSIPLSDQKNEKVNKVFNYILDHYNEDIKLEDVANIANYSQAAFCHFFKQHTQKTFVQFLIEVRISNACKMLRNTDYNISQVCYESGFNNVSNFNRQFKKLNGMSPTAYIKNYKEKELVG